MGFVGTKSSGSSDPHVASRFSRPVSMKAERGEREDHSWEGEMVCSYFSSRLAGQETDHCSCDDVWE